MVLREDGVDDVFEVIERYYSGRLSVWETTLSGRQLEKLDQIFEKVSNGGRG